MTTAAFPSTQPSAWPLVSLERFAISRARLRVVTLAVVTSLALGYRASRCRGMDSVGAMEGAPCRRRLDGPGIPHLREMTMLPPGAGTFGRAGETDAVVQLPVAA